MPHFGNQVETEKAPGLPSDVLVGHDHTIRDYEYAGPCELSVGQVVGWNTTTGRMEPLETDEHTGEVSGDGSETTFDLDHDAVDGSTLLAYESDGRMLACRVTHGTGSEGKDQVVFREAPDSTVSLRYYRTTATPAGVCLAEAELSEGDVVTLGTVVGGTVAIGEVTGAPGDLTHGQQYGALRFAEQ